METSICENAQRPSKSSKQRGAGVYDNTATKVKERVAKNTKNAITKAGTRYAQHQDSKMEIRKKTENVRKKLALHEEDEKGFFTPKTWFFWRGVLMYLFIFSIVGHWMEIPYCHIMHELFGIVEDDYAMWLDPWWVPYWVYGVGATVLTFTMLPLKIKLVNKFKSIWTALIVFFLLAVVLCAAMECIMGWIFNQPDEFGKFPYWDNSVLPGNIFGQAWIVNDVGLAFVSIFYVWLAFPLCQKFMKMIGDKWANAIFVACCIGAALIGIFWHGSFLLALL